MLVILSYHSNQLINTQFFTYSYLCESTEWNLYEEWTCLRTVLPGKESKKKIHNIKHKSNKMIEKDRMCDTLPRYADFI